MKIKILKYIVDVKPNACWSCDEFYLNGVCTKLDEPVFDASHTLPECPLLGVRDLKDPWFTKSLYDLVRLSGDVYRLQDSVAFYANHIRATEGDWKDDESKEYYRKTIPMKKYDYWKIATELDRLSNILQRIIDNIAAMTPDHPLYKLVKGKEERNGQ